MTNTRRQATMYLPPSCSDAIEELRACFNPVQHALIRAHVTLCREDEVDDWKNLESRLATMGSIHVKLNFGMPISDCNAVYLPTTGATLSFDDLRTSLLEHEGCLPRKYGAHITLMHPRNAICTDSIFESIVSRSEPFTATFRSITLIQQSNDGPWCDLKTFG